ncbi:MAG: periplasmic binding protein/LacI transcriptional regulator [Herbinix sp.]|jgi:ribose transport system substrate-binding protein|nr:periplasmic binding protein/LacI transcriptional regulator [Herbinix sp.]
MNEIKETIINDLMIIALAILLLVLLRVRDYKSEDMTAASMNRFYDIYLITIDNVDQYWYAVNQGAYDMAGLLAVNYRWEAPETKDIQKQIELLNQVVEKGADAILIAVNDPIQMSSAIENAKAKGVKIIYVDSPAYEEAVTTLATDNYSAGIEAGEAMIHELGELGIESGRIGIIGVNEVTDSTLKREAGFREAMRLDGRYTLVPTDYQNGDPIASQEAAAMTIRNYPDLVGIFGTNEGSTIGVGMAIKSQRRQIIGIGFDKSDVILELLRDGSLDAIVTQNPYTMGYLGMAEALASLKGMDTGPSNINTGVSIIRRR